jgi:hypothetical protein
MSNIGGTKREQKEFGNRKIGLFEGRVIAINPSIEDFKEVLGFELKEDSKKTEYLGENDEGNTTLRIDVWLEAVKGGEKFTVPFFLENKERENKDMTKKQYINSVGACSWADDPNNLPDWFKEREYRIANVGEEDLYNFLRTWLGNLDYRSAETVLEIEWKKLMKGNVKDLREQIDGEWSTTIGALATVIVKEKDGEIKEYQGVYNRAFLPTYALKNFRLVDYSDDTIVQKLKAKKPRDLKAHEKFVLAVKDAYGCKDLFTFKELMDYNPDDFLVSSDKVISEEGSDY